MVENLLSVVDRAFVVDAYRMDSFAVAVAAAVVVVVDNRNSMEACLDIVVVDPYNHVQSNYYLS